MSLSVPCMLVFLAQIKLVYLLVLKVAYIWNVTPYYEIISSNVVLMFVWEFQLCYLIGKFPKYLTITWFYPLSNHKLKVCIYIFSPLLHFSRKSKPTSYSELPWGSHSFKYRKSWKQECTFFISWERERVSERERDKERMRETESKKENG